MADKILRGRGPFWARLSVVVGLAVASPALAQTPDAALNGWISGLKAQGLDVAVSGVDADRAAKATVLRGVKISSGGATLSIGRLSIAEAGGAADTLTARHVEGDDLAMSGAMLTFKARSFQGDGLAIAKTTNDVKDPARPFQALIALVRDGLKSESGALVFDGVELAPAGAPSWSLAADKLGFDGLHRGALAGLKASGVSLTRSPGAEPVTLKSVVFGNVALGVAIDLLDPRSPINLASSRDWTGFIDQIAIEGFASSEGASKTTVNHLDAAGVKLRKIGVDLAKLMNVIATDPGYFSAHPDDAQKFSAALLDSLAIDKISALQTDVVSSGEGKARHATLGVFGVKALDPSAIGEINLGDLKIAQDGATIALDQLTLSKLEMVSVPAAGAPGVAPQVAGRAPFFGSGAGRGLSIMRPDGAPISIDSVSFNAPARVGSTPTRLVFALNGVKFPSALLPPAGLLQLVRDISPETLALDAEFAGGIDDSGTRFSVDRLAISVQQLTKLELSLSLVDVPSALDNFPAGLSDKLASASLDRASFRMTDDGLVGRVLAKVAEANKQDPDQFKRTLSANLPVMLGSIPDASARNSLIYALVGFLNDPQAIEFNTGISGPVPLVQLGDALKTAPGKLPGLVRLNARYFKKS